MLRAPSSNGVTPRRWIALSGACLLAWLVSTPAAHGEDAGIDVPDDARPALADLADAATTAPLDGDAARVDVPDTGTTDAGTADAGTADAGDAAAGRDAGAVQADASGGDAGLELIAEEETESLIPEEITESVSAVIASETTADVVRTLLGLVALLALAWVASHERVRRAEERLGLAPLMMSGLPFVLLGLVARAPGVEVLTEDVVGQLTPLLQFGLGWIGFHTGFQLDSHEVDRVPRGSATVVILLTTVPFALIALASVPVLYLLGLDTDVRGLFRDALMLGLAGALSAPAVGRLAGSTTPAAAELIRNIGVLDDVVCVVAFGCLAAWLRPASVGVHWSLPEVGWIFVTFGVAAVLGLLTYLVLRGTETGAEKISLLLGAVCLTTGIAAVFSLPPLVVCFLAGVLLRNLPGDDKKQLEESFARLERPIYHLFLLIVGALWRPELAAGWLLMPAFLAARTGGRWVGARLARAVPASDRPDALAETRDRDLTVPPMGQLAIAFVITAQTLYESEAVRAMVTAVVVSAVVLEVAFHALTRPPRAGSTTVGGGPGSTGQEPPA